MRDHTLIISLVFALRDVQLERSLTPQPEDVCLNAPTNLLCMRKIAAKAVFRNAQLIYTDKTKQGHVFQIVPMGLSHCRKVGYAFSFALWGSTHTSQLNFVSKHVHSLSMEILQLVLASLPARSTNYYTPITKQEHVSQNAPAEVTPTNGQWPACRAVQPQCRLSFRPTLPATTTPAPSSALSPSTPTMLLSAVCHPVPIPISTISKATNATPAQAPAARALVLPRAGPASVVISCRMAHVFRIALYFTTPTQQLKLACFPLPAGPILAKTLHAPASHHARLVPLPILQYTAAMPVPPPV